MNDLNVSAPASGLAVRFLDVGGCVRSGEDITREAVDQLLHLIQAAASCPLTCPWTSTARTGAPFSPWILTTAGPPWLSTHGTRRGKRIWISPPPRGAIVRRKPPYISADRRRFASETHCRTGNLPPRASCTSPKPESGTPVWNGRHGSRAFEADITEFELKTAAGISGGGNFAEKGGKRRPARPHLPGTGQGARRMCR